MNQSSEIRLGLCADIIDARNYQNAVRSFRENRIALPTFAELANPKLALPFALNNNNNNVLSVDDPDTPDPRNLWRVNWYNAADRKSRTDVPVHVILPPEFTSVKAPIVVLLGNKFPMIRTHKVLAAYACLLQRVLTGQFDPYVHRAIWPSTGNYARGGIAISRMMHCRATAILPEGMSRERFEWLAKWTEHPEDIVRTPGTESNVKEIYDACKELARDPNNIILNQFCEFPNYLAHYFVTGPALAAVFEHLRVQLGGGQKLRLAGFISATGSAGTIAAGDYLKERFGAMIVAVEALECPTMLMNGYGAHNIQGIGDKHIPLIHNVMNTDIVCAISDKATDHLDVLFNTPAGQRYLRDVMAVPQEVGGQLVNFGFSSTANVLAAIKTAKLLDLTPQDVLITVATDGSELYPSEREKTLRRCYPTGFGERQAAEVSARFLQSVATDHMLQLTEFDRNRIFNLGYYTWVEQQGVALEDFESRRKQSFWQQLRDIVPLWDERVKRFNEEAGIYSDTPYASSARLQEAR
jgi:cysteine synthase